VATDCEKTAINLPQKDEVHVWAARVSEHLHRVEQYSTVLSANEKQTSARFVYDKDRNCYMIAHGLLRGLLARYLHCKPEELGFIANEYGKPELLPTSNTSGLCFNLSHSGDRVLIAVTCGTQVGVDVERVREDLDVLELARAQFATDEIENLERLEPAERARVFFHYWTCKEAVTKAIGRGLSIPLADFTIERGADDVDRVVWLVPAAQYADQSSWSIFAFNVFDGYAAAVAVQRPTGRVILRDLK
jgi:4'-phosphopantetheinyl transferase